MNEEEYMRMFDSLNANNYGNITRDYMSGYIREELSRIRNADYEALPNLAGLSAGSDCVDLGISDLGISIKKEPKKDLTLAETMDLLSKGLKPYFYHPIENNIVELTLSTEGERGRSDIFWLPPRIAEKVEEKYEKINTLIKEKAEAIKDYEVKIKELEERVSLILKNGTDLIL